MKKLILSEVLFLITIFSLPAQSGSLSSNLFIQKAKEADEPEAYQCVQIRRGDRITLTGNIKFLEPKTGSDQKTLSFTSLGGRTFLLKGDNLQNLIDFINTSEENVLFTIKGIVLFEGLEDMPAELEVIEFSSSE